VVSEWWQCDCLSGTVVSGDLIEFLFQCISDLAIAAVTREDITAMGLGPQGSAANHDD
jgi:hypothetical protein